MSGADFWRVGYGADFARDIERIAASLERQTKLLQRIVDAIEEEQARLDEEQLLDEMSRTKLQLEVEP